VVEDHACFAVVTQHERLREARVDNGGLEDGDPNEDDGEKYDKASVFSL